MTPPSATETPSKELPKRYVAEEHEARWRDRWDAANGGKGAFHADPQRVLRGEREPYCILIPPPNVTARLHLGHAFNNTLQDILVRVHRMKGYETLWLPGTDHAGIATQTAVEKSLIQEGKPPRVEWDRDEFVEHVQAWKDRYEAEITNQLKLIGCSCDWSRQRFTMDDICARAVREAFFRLFRDGLIYRGKRLVNWDPATRTALADDEVEMQDVDGHFWYMKYPVVDDAGNETGDHVTVATTRPETYLGDTAVAVNPKDPERAAYIGKRVKVPFVGRIIPVIGDDYVVVPDPESSDVKAKYASGFLKVTPAHDPNDYEIGQRHRETIERVCSAGTWIINVMAPDASISDQHGWEDVGDASRFVGMPRYDARAAVEEAFKEAGLLADKRVYAHSVGHSYRSHVPVEPYLSDQWYCKVTDDRLRGYAQRAIAPEQRTSETWLPQLSSSTPPSGTGILPVSSSEPPLVIHRRALPHWQKGGSTYFVTFRIKDGELCGPERLHALHACFALNGNRAEIHIASVMPDHVLVLLTPREKSPGEWWSVDELAHAIKTYATEYFEASDWHEAHQVEEVTSEEQFVSVWNSILDRPVEAGLVTESLSFAYQQVGVGESTTGRIPSGRPVKAQRSDAGDGSMRFFPGRYAKTYEQWHDNLRDWCISRQLWWGHRIPVWTLEWDPQPWYDRYVADAKENYDEGEYTLLSLEEYLESIFGYYNTHPFFDNFEDFPEWGFSVDECLEPEVAYSWKPDGYLRAHICARTETAAKVLTYLQSFWREHRERIDNFDFDKDSEWGDQKSELFFNWGKASYSTLAVTLQDLVEFRQDSDVLDTWFSSALWPLNTMGWPEPDDHDETRDVLEAFNPTSVLSTAREIITLWVSRMAMFNRYFQANGDNPGPVPFKDVFIHAIIQDGEGQKMSKSLGNGVDPLDIVHSHGSDALRFTLCTMATQTQDVRLPVDVVCPHTGETFEPVIIDTPNGHRVMAPVQKNPKDPSKEMVSTFGQISGQATVTAERPLARNTSSKFDFGRNFCTKLWNAARFTMMQLGESEAGARTETVRLDELGMIDRWMLSRLAQTTRKIDACLAEYRFAEYGQLLYDILWRDFCDWYLEGIKPTVKQNPAQQSVLRHALDAILRLLHPVCPYVTESIWESVRTIERPDIEGLTLAEPGEDVLLCLAGWPEAGEALIDETIGSDFALLQDLTGQIRELRSTNNVDRKTRITLHTDAATADRVGQGAGLVELLAGLEAVTTDALEGRSVAFTWESREHHLTGLAGEVDAEAEKAMLLEQKGKLDRDIKALDGRLSNPGYVDKAPEHLVNQTREQRAQKQSELDAITTRLEELG
ncbi:MAG: valine--tRNA ligase [Planctomycetota bacterium]